MKKIAKKAKRKPAKQPAQSRSSETVAVILEAAARILEKRGLEGFNTNAVAERAGVSIGSVYQYFRNKDSLLATLIEQHAEPFVCVLEQIAPDTPFQEALMKLIEASVDQQMRRPELARLLDFVERQAKFEDLAKTTIERVQRVLTKLFQRPDAPAVRDRHQAALEVLSLSAL